MSESYFRRVAGVGVGAIAGALMIAGPVHAAPTPEPTASVEAQALGTATLQQDEFTLEEMLDGVTLTLDGTGFERAAYISAKVVHTATGAEIPALGSIIADEGGAFTGETVSLTAHADADRGLLGQYTVTFKTISGEKLAEDAHFTVTDGETPANDPASEDSWAFLMGDNMAVGFDYLYNNYGLVAVEGLNLDPESQHTVQVARDENFESIGIDREIVADEFGSAYKDANIVGLMSNEEETVGTYFVRVLDGSGELIGGVWTFEVVGGDQPPMPMETPTDEVPVDEAPVDEAPVDETPAEEEPVVEVDPTVVTHFAYDSVCSPTDSGREYTPGETYTWVACNGLEEPIPGTEIKIFETADGDLNNLEQGALVETVTTNEAGEFQMTVATDGYVGAISSVTPEVRVIVGQAPTAGGADEGAAPAEDSSSEAPADRPAEPGEAAPKGLPSTGV